MKLYLVQEKTSTCGYNGGMDYIFNLKGMFKNKENAERIVNLGFNEKGYVHNAVMTEIETDLFDGGGL